MAIVQNPIIGAASGQAGGMVFSRIFGNNIIRANPSQYRDLKSDAQVVHRSTFRTIILMVSMIKTYLPLFFFATPSKMSRYSKFVSLIMQFYPAGSTLTTPASKVVTVSTATLPIIDTTPVQHIAASDSYLIDTPYDIYPADGFSLVSHIGFYPSLGLAVYSDIEVTDDSTELVITLPTSLATGAPYFSMISASHRGKSKAGVELTKNVKASNAI
ncbi:MAG: hypothetical protein WCJ74_00975 [bacterium]